MVKSKGENGSLHPHQDWNIVDEREFNSYNIWLPLVDVNAENGT
jgi:ectoine hydroxylase-related dioxygenase (phytanoyl-CoA dioxygenase family)